MGVGKRIVQYAILLIVCAIVLNIPTPKISSGISITYSDFISALLFLSVGFYLGKVWSIKKMQKLKRHILWSSLSKREQEVAELILVRLSNQEISQNLFIEINTVKTHIKNIYKKTNVKGREEFRRHFEL